MSSVWSVRVRQGSSTDEHPWIQSSLVIIMIAIFTLWSTVCLFVVDGKLWARKEKEQNKEMIAKALLLRAPE